MREEISRVSLDAAAPRRIRQTGTEPGKPTLGPGELVPAHQPRPGVIPAVENAALLAIQRPPPERHDRLHQFRVRTIPIHSVCPSRPRLLRRNAHVVTASFGADTARSNSSTAFGTGRPRLITAMTQKITSD